MIPMYSILFGAFVAAVSIGSAVAVLVLCGVIEYGVRKARGLVTRSEGSLTVADTYNRVKIIKKREAVPEDIKKVMDFAEKQKTWNR